MIENATAIVYIGRPDIFMPLCQQSMPARGIRLHEVVVNGPYFICAEAEGQREATDA